MWEKVCLDKGSLLYFRREVNITQISTRSGELWLWFNTTLDYRGRKHCSYRCTVGSGISLLEHPDTNLWWTKGFPQYSTSSISMRTSVFSAEVNHLLWVTCVALTLQADQVCLSLGRESWFINGETQMSPEAATSDLWCQAGLKIFSCLESRELWPV